MDCSPHSPENISRECNVALTPPSPPRKYGQGKRHIYHMQMIKTPEFLSSSKTLLKEDESHPSKHPYKHGFNCAKRPCLKSHELVSIVALKPRPMFARTFDEIKEAPTKNDFSANDMPLLPFYFTVENKCNIPDKGQKGNLQFSTTLDSEHLTRNLKNYTAFAWLSESKRTKR